MLRLGAEGECLNWGSDAAGVAIVVTGWNWTRGRAREAGEEGGTLRLARNNNNSYCASDTF
jgi:hypothetical protein